MGPIALWTTAALLATTGAVNNLNRLNVEQCGRIGDIEGDAGNSLRVVGGELAEQGKFPWAASIQYEGRRGRQAACGGSLISNRHVITAGHCAPAGKQNPVSVILGQVNISRPLSNALCTTPKGQVPCTGVEIEIESVDRHPDYATINGAINDIAILTLAETVTFSKDIRPICIFHPNPDKIDNPSGNSRGLQLPADKYRVMGWGATVGGSGNKGATKPSKDLLWITLEPVNKTRCQELYKPKLKAGTQLLPSQICATGEKGRNGKPVTDSCNGDSGGPLALEAKVELESGEEEIRWFLAGAVSFGLGSCNSALPAIYTRIASYLSPFIQDKVLAGQRTPLCSGKLDAIFTMADKTTYAFLGREYWKLTDTGVASGYPRSIADDWDGLPDDIDAAFTFKGKTYMFKGSQYWRFREFGKLERRFPRQISRTFKEVPEDMDAALLLPLTDSLYFFKGTTFCKFEFGGSSGNRCSFSLPIDDAFEGIPGNLDTAFTDGNDKTYFFKGGNYNRFDAEEGRVDVSATPAYPRDSGKYWFGCPDSGTKFVRNGDGLK